MVSRKSNDSFECFSCDYFWRSHSEDQILEIVPQSHKLEKLWQLMLLYHNKTTNFLKWNGKRCFCGRFFIWSFVRFSLLFYKNSRKIAHISISYHKFSREWKIGGRWTNWQDAKIIIIEFHEKRLQILPFFRLFKKEIHSDCKKSGYSRVTSKGDC